jgi:hypothetical protein
MYREELLKHLKLLLVQKKREPSIERLVQFIAASAAFLSSKSDDSKESGDEGSDSSQSTPPRSKSEESESFSSFLIRYLLPLTDVKEKIVRFRSCQIIASLLTQMQELE